MSGQADGEPTSGGEAAAELPRAYAPPPLRAVLRAQPEDFVVEELPGYDADGSGEHVWLWVEKRGANTEWVARQLAAFCGVPAADVGYAGLKDRHAVTRQAFSLHLPGKAGPDWSCFAAEGVKLLEVSRHGRKLKRGALRGNRFVLRLREVQGDRQRAEQVMAAIAAGGVPNYFGEQRFGLDGRNLEQARAMFAGRRVRREMRSLLLSAARSQIFNEVLAARVGLGTWNQAMDGDVWSLAGSHSWFGPEAYTPTLAARLAEGDIAPSGPLWGEGEPPSTDAASALERGIAAAHPDLVAGLAAARMRHDRRALRLLPRELRWHWPEPDTLELSFELPAGSYATVVVRELLQ